MSGRRGVGKLVVEVAVRRLQPALDREHPVHEIADETKLDPDRGEERPEPLPRLPASDPDEGEGRARGADRAQDRDLVRPEPDGEHAPGKPRGPPESLDRSGRRPEIIREIGHPVGSPPAFPNPTKRKLRKRMFRRCPGEAIQARVTSTGVL